MTAMNEVAIVNETPAAALPDSRKAIVGRRGKVLGSRYYMGTKSAGELKLAGKALGLKGNKLNEWVNLALRNDETGRSAATICSVMELNRLGFSGDVLDVKSKTATFRFVKVVAPTVPDPAIAELATAKAELEAMKAEMAAMKAAK